MRADLQVASVVRDPQTGQPQRLSEERLTVGASLDDVTAVAWVDEITLAALGSSGVGDVTTYRIPLGGPTQALPFQEGVTGLAAAKERLYILADGVLLQQAGTGRTGGAAVHSLSPGTLSPGTLSPGTPGPGRPLPPRSSRFRPAAAARRRRGCTASPSRRPGQSPLPGRAAPGWGHRAGSDMPSRPRPRCCPGQRG